MIPSNSRAYSTDQLAEINEMVGIPFIDGGSSPSGCDCWGLVQLFYKNVYHIKLPSYPYLSALNKVSVAASISKRQQSAEWLEVKDKQIGHVVLFNIKGRPAHCGVIVDNERFIHCVNHSQTCIEPLNSSAWRSRITGYYRWQTVQD